MCTLASPYDRHISDTWWLMQDTDGPSSSPPLGGFSKVKDSQLEEPEAMCMVSLSSGSKGHRATVAPSWEEVGVGGLLHHGGAMVGTVGAQGRMQSAPRCCLTLLCLLLSAPTVCTPRQGPSSTHVPFCGSTLDLALMQDKSSVSSPSLAVIYSLYGLSLPPKFPPPLPGPGAAGQASRGPGPQG